MIMTPVWQGGGCNHDGGAMPIDHNDGAMPVDHNDEAMPTMDPKDEAMPANHDDKTTKVKVIRQSDLGATWQWVNTGNDSDNLTTGMTLRTTGMQLVQKRWANSNTYAGQ
ncbi:hypothetical protein EDB89DRAFT_1900229 [Lactarius sanguifluus]|nr:hypothetical protein EDB89DRAFT_1900229 [Lactarius sanguifluus]